METNLEKQFSKIAQIINTIFGLYETMGHSEYIGEPVSILEHSLQTAHLAEKANFDDEIVLAAFFHDIGHLLWNEHIMTEFGNIQHEIAGEEYLVQNGFSEKITTLVKNHVQAKRYLTFSKPDYYQQLSEASKQTLILQGGKMTEEEANKFVKDEYFQLSLKMRYWDESAKNVTLNLKHKLKIYQEMAFRHLVKAV